MTAKATKDLKINVKINDSIGYINKQINDLSKKITSALTVKLKIDATALSVVTARVKQAQQNVNKASGTSNTTNVANTTQTTNQATVAMNNYSNAVSALIQK